MLRQSGQGRQSRVAQRWLSRQGAQLWALGSPQLDWQQAQTAQQQHARRGLKRWGRDQLQQISRQVREFGPAAAIIGFGTGGRAG
jgi:hypothetical protein